MKLKHIAAAIAVAASAPAFASIAPPATTGSELFLVVWEQNANGGKPDTSFTFDTGITYASFMASASTSSIWATFTSSNTDFFNFLAGADLGSLQYAVIGGKSPSPGTLLSTVHVGDESLVSQGTNSQISTALAQITTYLSDVNVTGNHASVANGQSVNASGDPAYFQDANRPMYNFNGTFVTAPWSNSNALGTAAEFTSLARVTGSPGLAGRETILPGVVNFAQVGGNYVLSYTVAAVPEASSLGMALAGLGVLGFMGVRRRNPQA